MKLLVTLALLAATMVTAQETNTTSVSSVPYSNPETSYTTETNSLGVITGQPTPVTTQPGLPAAVTSQPAAASIYAGLSQGLNTVIAGNRTLTVNVSGNSTSVVTPTPTTQSTLTTNTASGTTGTGSASGSKTGSSSSSTSSGAAADVVKMASGALVGAAGVFALFL